MKKKLPYLLPSIVFFLGAPIVWFLCFREVPLRISPETTYLTESKTADGKSIDYFAAIKDRFEPKCRQEENGFRTVAAALGKSPYFGQPDWYWPELCKELGLDPNLTPTLKFEPPHEFLKREFLLWLDENAPPAAETAESEPGELTDTEKIRIRIQNEPWTADEFPFMARWIEENSTTLDLVAEALRREAFFLPLLRPEKPTDGAEAPIVLLNVNRQCGNTFFHDVKTGFALRAQYRLGKGDVSEANRDMMSVAWYAAHSARLPFEDPRISAEPTSAWFHRHRADQATEEEMLRFPRAPSFEDFSIQCRLILLYDAEFLARNEWSPYRYVDWNIVFRTINRHFDQLNGEVRNGSLNDTFSEKPPSRSWLGRLLGKPVTVAERSKELGWAYFQIYRFELTTFAKRETPGDQ